MPEQNSEQNKVVARRALEEMDKQNGPVDEFHTDDSVAFMLGAPPIDLPTYQRFSGAFFKAFPDLIHGVDEVIGEGDRVVMQLTCTATHQGEFEGIPATGNRVKYPSFVIFTFRDGKISETRAVFDQTGLMRQIGG